MFFRRVSGYDVPEQITVDTIVKYLLIKIKCSCFVNYKWKLLKASGSPADDVYDLIFV